LLGVIEMGFEDNPKMEQEKYPCECGGEIGKDSTGLGECIECGMETREKKCPNCGLKVSFWFCDTCGIAP